MGFVFIIQNNDWNYGIMEVLPCNKFFFSNLKDNQNRTIQTCGSKLQISHRINYYIA